MGQLNIKTREVILERMCNRVVSRSDLNDLNNNSQVKQVLAAAAREDDDVYFQMIKLLDLFDLSKVRGQDLVERGKEFNPSIISKLPAKKATTSVVFGRTGTSGVATISAGTQVKVPASGNQAEVIFVTTEDGTIPDTLSVSGAVNVVAEEAGAQANVGVATITAFVSKPSGVDTVSNASAVTNGQDEESDDSFYQRLIRSIQGLARAHVQGLESAAFTGEDTGSGKSVKFAQVVEDPINRGNVTLYIDDGSGSLGGDIQLVTGGTVLAAALGGETVLNTPNKPLKTENGFTLYINASAVPATNYTINPASGQINLLPAAFPTGLTAADAVTYDGTHFTGLIAEVQKIIDGDPGDRSNYPGYRAAGVLVRVLPPNIVFQTVTANLTVLAGFNQDDVRTVAVNAISNYVNNLGISEDLILNELRERVMAISGMYDVQFSAPTENQVILDNQMARVLQNNINLS